MLLIDQRRLDWSAAGTQALRQICADACPLRSQLETAATRAGLPLSRVPQANTVFAAWQLTLDALAEAGRLRTLVEGLLADRAAAAYHPRLRSILDEAGTPPAPRAEPPVMRPVTRAFAHRYLPPEMVRALFQHTCRAGMTRDEDFDGLTANLPAGYRASLPSFTRRPAILRFWDLLNQVERLSSGEIPLQIVLMNALTLSVGTPDEAGFRAAWDALTGP